MCVDKWTDTQTDEHAQSDSQLVAEKKILCTYCQSYNSISTAVLHCDETVETF